jgi:transcription-repair coupling factor (superfamily II helicase)
VKALKSGKEPDLEKPLHSGPELDLHVPALIPEDYMPDVHLRLVLYKRIAAAPDGEALEELEAEMVDRFGPLPPPTQNLFRITRLKLRAARLGLRKLEVGPLGGLVEFGEDHVVDPKVVLKLVQREAKVYRLDGPNRLRFTRKHDTDEARCKAADGLLAALGAP